MSKTDVYVLLEYFVNEQTVDTTMATVQAVEANMTQQDAEIVWIVKFTTSVLNKLAVILKQIAQVATIKSVLHGKLHYDIFGVGYWCEYHMRKNFEWEKFHRLLS